MTKGQLKIKQEPVSDDETKSKHKVHSKKRDSLDRESLISKLVSDQVKDQTKKKRKKPHDDSQDLSSGAPTPKKIKVKKNSEDVSTPLRDEHKSKIDNSHSEGAYISPNKIKKEKDVNGDLLEEEKNILNKLFAWPQHNLLADSIKNSDKKSLKPEKPNVNNIRHSKVSVGFKVYSLISNNY